MLVLIIDLASSEILNCPKTDFWILVPWQL